MLEYSLKPSLALLRFNMGLYCLSCLVLLSYSSTDYMTLLLFLLVILSAVHQWTKYRQVKDVAREALLINTAKGHIEWCNNNKNCQFSAYSVYTCRWGMILVLKRSWISSSLILLPDRFDNNRQYLDLRFHLIHSEQAVHAS